MGSDTLHAIDPLFDPRWQKFLELHPCASVFHTPSWLAALRRAYDYHSAVLTTAPPGEPLRDGIVFCQVASWLTGRRIVSVPFADHCDPLLDRPETLPTFLSALHEQQVRTQSTYIELRPLNACIPLGQAPGFAVSAEFYFHTLDLRPNLDAIYRNLHKSCIQRKIARAEREGLVYEQGRSQTLLERFYHLLLLTRRRHRIPPQPLCWFRYLLDSMGGQARIHLVSKADQPVASILTVRFKDTLVYKYGCSDERFHHLGGMPFLFWTAIQEGKERGALKFDLGRSDLDNPGLAQFKDHLGAACSRVIYYRSPPAPKPSSLRTWAGTAARSIACRLPDRGLASLGSLLYKHAG